MESEIKRPLTPGIPSNVKNLFRSPPSHKPLQFNEKNESQLNNNR